MVVPEFLPCSHVRNVEQPSPICPTFHLLALAILIPRPYVAGPTLLLKGSGLLTIPQLRELTCITVLCRSWHVQSWGKK